MASCITAQWVSTAPQMKLVVEGSSASTDTTAVLNWTLYYIASYPPESYARPWSVVINGSTVGSGSFAINGKAGTHTVSSGTVNVARGTAAKSVSFSVTVDWSLTWSGVYKGSVSASSSISVAAITSYAVSYNANGGSGAPGGQTKWHGTNLKLQSTIPTRTGYTFLGWATTSSGSVAYAAGATYSANAPVTLYAKWQAITYTVTYDANGGTGAPGNQTKTYGVTLKLSSTKPTRTNYNFIGWGTSAAATTIAYASGANYTGNAPLNLYAIWEIAYILPRITELSVTRCNASGTAAEDGTCAKVSFSWSTDQTVSSVKIEWKTAASTTWSNSATVTASGTNGTVEQVVGNGAISTDNTYNFRITVADGGGSSSTITVVGGLAYAIDYKAGGKGVSFGKPAENDGFDCNFDALFRKPVSFDGKLTDRFDTEIGNGLAAYSSGGIDPNTTLEELCLTNHSNAPISGTFFYIQTAFYNTKATSSNRAQFAFPYNASGSMYHRFYSGGTWSDWRRHLNEDEAAYYVASNTVASQYGTSYEVCRLTVPKTGVYLLLGQTSSGKSDTSATGLLLASFSYGTNTSAIVDVVGRGTMNSGGGCTTWSIGRVTAASGTFLLYNYGYSSGTYNVAGRIAAIRISS